MSVAIIDYGSGNLHSADKAFERAAREAGLDAGIVVTVRPGSSRKAERMVLPGVGAFADCRRGLDAVPGMVEAMTEAVTTAGGPFLGICVGMQLMATRGLEYGVTPGLGWIAGDVRRSRPSDPELKIPHMGWNTLDLRAPHPLLDGIPTGEDGLHAYFVHSYVLDADDPGDVVADRRLRRPVHRHRRPGQYGRHAVPPREEPGPRPRSSSPISCGGARDPVSRHRPEGRPAASAWCRATWTRRPCSTTIRPTRRDLRGARASSGCTWSISTAPSRASR